MKKFGILAMGIVGFTIMATCVKILILNALVMAIHMLYFLLIGTVSIVIGLTLARLLGLKGLHYWAVGMCRIGISILFFILVGSAVSRFLYQFDLWNLLSLFGIIMIWSGSFVLTGIAFVLWFNLKENRF